MLRSAVCSRASSLCARPFTTSSVTRAQSTDLSYPTHTRPTPYEIFHLPRSASQNEIKDRYYELVRLHHPDSPSCRHEPDEVRQERFTSIGKAYEALKRSPNPAMLEELHWRHRQHMQDLAYTTRRSSFAYHPPGQRAVNVGNGDIFVVVTILAIIGSAALMYSPIAAAQRADRSHLNARVALAEARREGKENGAIRRDQIRKWIEEAGVQDVPSDTGRGGTTPRMPPSST